VRKTTKLIEGGHRGFQDYRYMLLLLLFLTFFTFFKIQKSRDFLRFFAVFRTFSRTMVDDDGLLISLVVTQRCSKL